MGNRQIVPDRDSSSSTVCTLRGPRRWFRRRRRLNRETSHTVTDDLVEEMDLASFLQYDPHAYQLMEGQTALHLVALAGRVDLLQYLLTSRKIDVNMCNHTGRTALAEVIVAGTSAEILDVFWRQGASLLERNTIHYICERGCDDKIFALVLEHLDNVDALSDDACCWTPLHAACRFGQLKLVRTLLDNGASLSVQSHQNITPLELVCAHDQVEVARWLLQQHPPGPHDDSSWNTLLCTACRSNSIDTTRLLVESYGVDPYRTINGMSPFDCAREGAGFDTLYYLLRDHNALRHCPLTTCERFI